MTWFCTVTPQSILDNDEVDIFGTLIPEGTYHTKICDALWQMYRFRRLGSHRNEFEQRLVDRYNLTKEKYESIFDWYETNKSKLTDITTMTQTSVGDSKSEALPDTSVSSTEYLTNRGHSDNTMTYQSGMNAELFSKMMSDKADPYYIYAYEFETLFSEFL